MTKLGPKILLLDIETAPHRVFAWGLWGQDIHLDQIEAPGYTICWAAKWLHGSRMMFEKIGTTARTRKQMLLAIHKLLDEADVVVHYNGMKFDIPTLNGEFLAHGLRPPSPYHQVDLLATARRAFKLASNKLDYVASHLGITGKVRHKGMELWLGCMQGDPASWRTMERYNKRDVVILEKVYLRALPWIEQHPNHGMWNEDERPACPNCGSFQLQRRGVRRTLTRQYHQYVCKACGRWSRARLSVKGKSPEIV